MFTCLDQHASDASTLCAADIILDIISDHESLTCRYAELLQRLLEEVSRWFSQYNRLFARCQL